MTPSDIDTELNVIDTIFLVFSPQHWKWHWLNIVLIIGKDRTLRSVLVKSWLREARGKAVSTKTGGSSAQWC